MRKQHHEGSWTNGLDDGLGQAIELVIAPLLFGLAGFGLDRWWGTGRVFTLVLGLFGVIGAFVVAYYRYDARMKLERERLEARRTAARTGSWTRP